MKLAKNPRIAIGRCSESVLHQSVVSNSINAFAFASFLLCLLSIDKRIAGSKIKLAQYATNNVNEIRTPKA